MMTILIQMRAFGSFKESNNIQHLHNYMIKIFKETLKTFIHTQGVKGTGS